MRCIEKGYIFFDFDDYSNVDNFYVKNPDKVLELATGVRWSVKKESADYKSKQNEYVVEFWTVNGKTGHFARTRKNYNSLQRSVCVSQGYIGSLRVFRVEK